MRIIFAIALFVVVRLHAAEPDLSINRSVREEFSLSPFYSKCMMVGDFPVVSSSKVSDAALSEASHTVKSMLTGREDILSAMASNKVRLSVMATTERTCDLPEHADLTPRAYWNRRARGLGASRERPAVSCGEENLLNCLGDPYPTESIMVHEFAHAIHQMGVNSLDKTFDDRLEKAYTDALEAGKWKDCYAAENRHEYWAEAVQSWFGTNRENDAIHNHVNTRAELIEYDPAVAKLCREVFKDNDWVYVRADDPARKSETHLRGLDRSKLPKFEWSAKEQESSRKDP